MLTTGKHLRFLLAAAFMLLGFARANAQATITVNGAATICPGDSVILSASQGDSYQWLNFGFPIFGATSQTYAAKQTGQYTVVVTISMIPFTSNTVAITVSPIPTVFINASAQTVCPGTQISLNVSGGNNSGLAAGLNQFLATDAHVAIPHQSHLNSNTLTVEVWARPQQNTATVGIASKLPIATSLETGYGFRQVGNRFQFCIGREGNEIIAQSNTFNMGPWYHLTGTYDGTSVKIYVNGVLHSTTAASGHIINSSADIIVGNFVSMTGPFKGLVDELRVWNYAATAADIQCNYKVSAYPGAAGLVGYWPMNTLDGNTTPDISTFGNDGLPANGANLVSSGAGLTHMFVWDAAPGIANQYATCMSLTPTVSHIYRVVATSNAGCVSEDTSHITVLPLPVVYNVTGGGIYCTNTPGMPIGLSNSETGVIYQLKKNNVNFGGPVAGTGSPLTLAHVTEAGTYTVAATLGTCSNTMSGSAVVEVFSSPEIISWVIDDPDCNGGTGSIDVTLNAGTPPFVYSWSSGDNTEDINGKPAGSYAFEVSDTKGCNARDTFTITEPTPALVSASTTNVVCNGNNDGTITLVTGGTPPHTFAWSNAATTQNLSNIGPGNYSVTVTDALNCTGTASYTITEPAALVVTGVATNITCNGLDNGAIDITVSGGTAPYTYSWSNSAATQDLNSLSPGIYDITVTDANGCTATASFTITEPQSLAAAAVVDNVNCYGDNTGSIALTVAGGTTPYTYLWSNSAATEDLSGLMAGTYTVTVTDANGCIAQTSATVSQPAAALAMSGTETHVGCYGDSTGAVNITVAGGTAPYSYNWSNGAGTEDISGVAAGTYTVTVTDANGCTVSASYTITQPGAFVITGSTTNTTCFGGSDGAIDITTTGGSGPYAYSWSNAATTEDVSSLAAGTYTVTVTYGSGCTYSETFTVASPAQLTATAAATTVTCTGNNTDGTATVTATGGTAPYSYQWSNNATTQNITGLTPGTYTVTVTDANGCTANASAIVNQPAPVAVTGVAGNAACFGSSTGSVDLVVTSGTAPFTYLWSNNATTQHLSNVAAGTYTVTVTDNNNCTVTASFTVGQPAALSATAATANISCYGAGNGAIDLSVAGGTAPYTYQWSNNAATQDISNLAAGTYSVVITDANGCTANAGFTITEPAAVAIAGTVTDVTANGGSNGSINITVSGGTAPYTYLWSNNTTAEDPSGLAAGNYSVTVTDANGCTATASYTVDQPAIFIVNGTVANASCGNNGSVTLSTTGGVAPFSYLWSNNATTQNITGLAAGTYSVTITDAANTVVTASFTVGTSGQAVTATASVTGVQCYGQNNGSIILAPTGGTAPYTYNWGNNITSKNRYYLSAGTYTVTITDANGCTAVLSFNVSGPSAPVNVAGTVTDVTCYGDNNGAIDATVTGGTAPYTYNWLFSSANTEDRSNLSSGLYYLYVTDANGCNAGKLFIVHAPAPIIAYGSTTKAGCNGGGSVNLSVYGGTAPYTYSWSNGATTQDISNLAAGNYSVTITDANGCQKTLSFTITQQAPLNANISVSPVVTVTNGQPYTIYLGYGPQSVLLSASVNGGSGPYTYNWSGTGINWSFASFASVSPNATQTYTLTVTDANGCTKTVSQVIEVIDVRDGNNDNKIIICHKGKTKSVNKNSIQSHLNHGDYLGACDNAYNKQSPQEEEEEEETHDGEVSGETMTDLVAKDISVYPNPSDGTFTLLLPTGETQAQILITDVLGKVVERRMVMGVNTAGFDLSNAARGTYNIRVTIGQDVYTSRVMLK